ncbi:unnamed protein product [Linum tenue]|uniref:Uncharacterized protein n=1 Tax=Linum tenue TaxID=586396 RepID=A0AAV0N1X7_9ROSI|nr:unnamed protein product [Linum tenue]
MERSRSKRNYYYDHQDYDNDGASTATPLPPPPPLRTPNNTSVARQTSKPQSDTSLMVTTTYRILCTT